MVYAGAGYGGVCSRIQSYSVEQIPVHCQTGRVLQCALDLAPGKLEYSVL